jgi:putative DNA primase/helicase
MASLTVSPIWKPFVALHGHDFRFVEDWNCFLVWTGKRWERSNNGALVKELAKKVVRGLYGEAANIEDDDSRKALIAWARSSESQQRITAMVSLAKSDPGIRIKSGVLDANPDLLNVKNGTIDLSTGKFRRARREDMITNLCPVDYSSSAEAPIWQAFLTRTMAGNKELISFLQRAFGYSATGHTGEEVLFMPYGTGRNGKSKCLGAIEYVLGDYAQATRSETLMAREHAGIPNDIAALKGARFVSAIEVEEGKRLAESMVKALTDGDVISARFLHGEFFNFLPTHKLWLACNHKPTIRGTDTAIWERVILIPFTVTIPAKERDKRLAEKLQTEAPGILRWIVDGAVSWHQVGLNTPVAVTAATKGYRLEMDTLGDFLDECCVQIDAASVAAGILYEAYKSWCERSGEHLMSSKMLGRQLRERGFETKKTEQAALWQGLGLLDLMHDAS